MPRLFGVRVVVPYQEEERMRVEIQKLGSVVRRHAAKAGFAVSVAMLTIASIQVGHAQQEAPDPDSVILDRQLIMQDLDKRGEEIGSILSGVSKPDKMHEVALAIAKDAKDAYESFKPNVPGGGSKPEVWANWDDFSKRMERFVAKSDAMAKASEKGSVADVGNLVIEALPCQECHDVYRVKK